MKLSSLVVASLAIALTSVDSYAQRRPPGTGGGGSAPRGPSYNPSPSRPSSPPSRPSAPSRPTTQPSRPSAPSYNPGNRPTTQPNRPTTQPNRPTTQPNRPTTQPNRPTGPNYNPPRPGTRPNGPTTQPNRPNRPTGPNYNPPRPGTRPNRPVYTPSRPTTYRPVYRVPSRNYYGTPNYHRPPMYRPVAYNYYRHNPWTQIYIGSVRYNRPWDYYSWVRNSYPNYFYVNWLFFPVTGYSNGYSVFNNYPYYVYNGYRFRYSSVDQCNYQLVDQYTHRVVRTYWNQSCNRGYDQCSFERDQLNAREINYRYFCAETYRDQNYDWNRPTYDYNYNDYDYNDNGYNNYPTGGGYNDGNYDYGHSAPTTYPEDIPSEEIPGEDDGQDCYDYDYENDVCYDEQEPVFSI